jgi:EAL domain-containing protein (putative c-di-GMP-specific phosphodiesterase class I)
VPGAALASLTDALGPGRLEPHFQAVVECGTGTVRAVEALARWRTRGGLIEGEDLVELVRQVGCCALLDAEMLELAVAQVASWRRLPGLHALELHVNLSPESLRDPALVQRVERTYREGGLVPTALWMEVTETSVIDDLPVAATALERLRSLGIRIWVDDFGAGYASLSYVKQLPIDGVKIDRSFVTDIQSSEAGRAIVAAVVSMASPLALDVIAEGVESEQQAEVVRSLGVHATQGFYHGRPQPPSGAIGGLRGLLSPIRAVFASPASTAEEEARLRVVAACMPLPGERDPELEEVARFLAEVCEVEIAVIGVDDRDRTRCLAQHGCGQDEESGCSAVIQLMPATEMSVVPDMSKDPRFASDPVVRDGGMRFLAGEMLTVDGQRVGSVVLVGARPRRPTRRQLRFLHQAAERAQAHLQLRYVRNRLRETEVALALART